jgi:hypothetical protein
MENIVFSEAIMTLWAGPKKTAKTIIFKKMGGKLEDEKRRRNAVKTFDVKITDRNYTCNPLITILATLTPGTDVMILKIFLPIKVAK